MDTEWEFSKEIAVEEVKRENLTAGVHRLQIVAAMFNSDKNTYEMTLRSLDTDEENRFVYYLMKKDGNKNNFAIGTLNSLKHALRGKGDGILAPCDILWGIVKADVKLGEPQKNSRGEEVQYRSIYHFEPVTIDYFELVKDGLEHTQQQYTAPAEEEE